MMRKISLLLLLGATTLASFAQSEKEERIAHSYAISFGWVDQGGVNYWLNTQDPKDKDLTLDQLIERHRNFMYSLSPESGKKAIKAAVWDVVGVEGSSPEIAKYSAERKTYAQVCKAIVKFLKERHQAGMNEYTETIRRAYFAWNKANIAKADLEKYKKEPFMRYIDWYKYFKAVAINQPLVQAGATRTVQATRSLMYAKEVQIEAKPSLITELNKIDGIADITLSSAMNGLASQAGQKSSLKLPDNKNWISNNSGNCISTGGGNVIMTGGGNVISTGGGNVISTGGGN